MIADPGVAGFTDRQLLETTLLTLRRLEKYVSANADYMTAALDSLDVQMANLSIRLQADAAALAAALAAAGDGASDSAALSAAAARVQATAELVAGLNQPSAVADPALPDTTATEIDPVAEPLPEEPVIEEASPPAEEEFPPAEEEFPPAEEEFPSVEGESPPVEEESPPVEEESPLVEEEERLPGEPTP